MELKLLKNWLIKRKDTYIKYIYINKSVHNSFCPWKTISYHNRLRKYSKWENIWFSIINTIFMQYLIVSPTINILQVRICGNIWKKSLQHLLPLLNFQKFSQEFLWKLYKKSKILPRGNFCDLLNYQKLKLLNIIRILSLGF